MPDFKGEPPTIPVPDPIMRGLIRLVQRAGIHAQACLDSGWNEERSCPCPNCDLICEWQRFIKQKPLVDWINGVLNGGGRDHLTSEVPKWRRN